MNKSVKLILSYCAALIVLSGTVVVINQTIQFADFMERFHPVAGDVTFWLLISLYVAFLTIPLVMYFKLPKRMELPTEEDSPEFEQYLQAVRTRLAQNKNVEGKSFETRDDIEKAIVELDKKALDLVKNAGSKTFLFTAISQFGAMDTIMVLGTQTRLIWDIAHLYNQRPTLRDMWYLYSNVITTAFITGEINDVDFAEIVQPVISKTLGSAGGVIPGTTMFVNSVFTGTTNAFLMLRVGIITRNYCGALVKKERSFIRRSAIGESAALLSIITMEGGKKLSESILKATGKTVSDAVTGASKSIFETGKKIVDGLKF